MNFLIGIFLGAIAGGVTVYAFRSAISAEITVGILDAKAAIAKAAEKL